MIADYRSKDFINGMHELCKQASEKILEVYSKDISVDIKDDNSPVTIADHLSHNTIVEYLKSNFQIPVLSEEDQKNLSYEQRKDWDLFWLVDPLDGTKEFISKNGEFTINIALIEKGEPIFGCIFIPVTAIFYHAAKDNGAYKVENNTKSKLPTIDKRDIFTVIASRSHLSPEVEQFIEEKKQQYKKVDSISAGSSLKFCMVAEGRADVYPRFGPTMEWDTAAGHIIAQESGCCVLDAKTKEPLRYNKEDLHNPWFIVKRDS